MSNYTTTTNVNMNANGAVNGMSGAGPVNYKQQPAQQYPLSGQYSQPPGSNMVTATPNMYQTPKIPNKFLPPTQSQQHQSQQQSQQQPQQQPQGLSNGPLRPPPLAATTGVSQASTIQSGGGMYPPHLRPTPTSTGSTNAGMPLANGSHSNSVQSSRTASPALQPHQQPHQQLYQQPPQQPPQQLQQQLAPPMSSFANTPMSNLTGSMQNLNINRTMNGQQQSMSPSTLPRPTASAMVPPPADPKTTQFQTNPPPATAMHRSPLPPTTSQPLTNHLGQPSPIMLPSSAAGPTRPPPIPSSTPGAMFGTSSTAPTSISSVATTTNANYNLASPPPPPTSTAAVGLPPTAMPPHIMNQNQINNNQEPQQQQQPQHHLPYTQARRPMYPTTTPPEQQPQQQAQLFPPSMPPPPTAFQQPQQQPYGVHQPPQQQPGNFRPPFAFGANQNTEPMQYQNQGNYQTLQQQQQQQYVQGGVAGNVVNQGFSRLWGQDTIDLMQNRRILSPATQELPKINLHNQFQESINCNPLIMRSTVTKIPESSALLQKSRLPLGILIHPYRDINSLPVIQCPTIVRCRLCRTYINPFVYFVDSKMWKCNLCYRVNELPEDFLYDPATRAYGDVTRRPEVRSSTIEFIAPSEYMLRPPQPAIYLFLFDVSIIAQQCGYLENVCATLSKHLDDMPGDARTQVGFIAYNSQVHFYSLCEGYNQPHEMTLLDIDEPFLPRPDNLLVNLKECKELVKDLLSQMPTRFADTHDPGSALGAALQVAFKLMQASGGRITVFQTCLPNKGPGALEAREDPNNRSAKDVAHLNPATDFFKRYALECSGYQIAVDLFLLNQQYSDLATISGISKHSGGCVHHFPLYQKTKPQHVDSLKQCFIRYLTRKIGFEAVMRVRCTRGLQVHTFHGNFFVRSTDLLSLPNVNPDAGYGMQISYEESLADAKTVCFQAALLYTNSEGERRIRVHTLCLPVTSSLPEVMHSADTQAIVGLLAKMAVDRSLTSNVADAREAFINATVDIFNAFKIAQNLPSGQSGQLIAPRSLALLPLYILALLKHPAFRLGTSTRLDDRVFAMDCMKTLPLDQLMKFIYPEFYQLDSLFAYAQSTSGGSQSINANQEGEEDDEEDLPEIAQLQLTAEYLDSRCVFLMDCGIIVMIYVGLNVPPNILEGAFGIKYTAELPDYCYGLPNVSSRENAVLRRFIMELNDEKPYKPIVQIIRDTSTAKPQFVEKLVDDRSESSLSYYEFLQHIRSQVK